MKKVIVIHSYNGDTEQSFAEDIKERCRRNGLEYRFPHFPVRKEASYEEWKKVMEKETVNADTVLIAHSLGTQFVPRYLAENNISADTYISVAGYLHYEGRSDLEEINRNFEPSAADFEKCRTLVRRRISLYSNNDRMNPAEKLEAYAEAIDAEKMIIDGAGHFDPASGITKLPIPEDILNS